MEILQKINKITCVKRSDNATVQVASGQFSPFWGLELTLANTQKEYLQAPFRVEFGNESDTVYRIATVDGTFVVRKSQFAFSHSEFLEHFKTCCAESGGGGVVGERSRLTFQSANNYKFVGANTQTVTMPETFFVTVNDATYDEQSYPLFFPPYPSAYVGAVLYADFLDKKAVYKRVPNPDPLEIAQTPLVWQLVSVKSKIFDLPVPKIDFTFVNKPQHKISDDVLLFMQSVYKEKVSGQTAGVVDIVNAPLTFRISIENTEALKSLPVGTQMFLMLGLDERVSSNGKFIKKNRNAFKHPVNPAAFGGALHRPQNSNYAGNQFLDNGTFNGMQTEWDASQLLTSIASFNVSIDARRAYRGNETANTLIKFPFNLATATNKKYALRKRNTKKVLKDGWQRYAFRFAFIDWDGQTVKLGEWSQAFSVGLKVGQFSDGNRYGYSFAIRKH